MVVLARPPRLVECLQTHQIEMNYIGWEKTHGPSCGEVYLRSSASICSARRAAPDSMFPAPRPVEYTAGDGATSGRIVP